MSSKQSLYAMLFYLGSKLGSFCKVSFMIGSYAAFFSVANCLVPLTGAFCGMAGSTMLFGLALCLRMVLHGALSLSLLAQFVPGLCAGYYWASRSALIRVFIPVVCMVLFMVHPVGGMVWIYAFYWLIPIALYLFNTNHIFATALGSTFTAHAVGSVIWLYTVPMDVAAWKLLIPIVFFERLVFAAGMVVMHKIISWGVNAVRAMHTKRVASAT